MYLCAGGPEAFLRTLLGVLKGGWVVGATDTDYQDDEEAALHAEVDADEADEYVVGQVHRRLGTEINILGRSVVKLRTQISQGNIELGSEIEQLESDASILREAMTVSPESWEHLSYQARRLVILYLIERVVVWPCDADSIEEQLKIEWRIPIPAETDEDQSMNKHP